MSAARMSVGPNERGMYVVSCVPCDASAEFPNIAEAVLARRLHLCEGEVPSCSWPGWALGFAWWDDDEFVEVAASVGSGAGGGA